MKRYVVYIDFEVCAESATQAEELVLKGIPGDYNPSVSDVSEGDDCEEEDA